MFEERITKELQLLRSRFPKVEYKDGWFRLPGYLLPTGWGLATVDLAFEVKPTYPGSQPYGFFARDQMRFNGELPTNYQDVPQLQPIFDGKWSFFSWQAEDGQWNPKTDVEQGSNLLNWALSFAERFKAGK